MKRVVLIGAVILFANCMAIAGGLDINSDMSLSAGTYDYLKIAFNGDAAIDNTSLVDILGEINIGDDGTSGLGYTGSLTINTGGGLWSAGNIYIGGNGTATPTATVSVNGNGGLQTEGSIYIGGTVNGASGDGVVSVSGMSFFGAGESLNLGWVESNGDITSTGELFISSDSNIMQSFPAINIMSGTVHYIIDAMFGVTPLTGGQITFYEDSVIDLGFNPWSGPADYDGLAWNDPLRWTVLANGSDLQWGNLGDAAYSGVTLTGDPNWSLVERTPNVLEAYYAVPEPTTMVLIGLGGLVVAAMRRKQ